MCVQKPPIYASDEAVQFRHKHTLKSAGGKFANAELLGLWHLLQARGELGRWAREVSLEPPRRGRPRKNQAD